MLQDILTNSYKDFHAKGLHYLCLQRSPRITLKAYFFEGTVSSAPEIVIPHNHRYNFLTQVLAGELLDKEYREIEEPDIGMALRTAQKWDYMTPLNGGKGFKWLKETNLWWAAERTIKKGSQLFSPYNKIHTIAVKPDTVLLLTQFQDELPIDKPSSAYSFNSSKEHGPNTDGLYSKFTADEVQRYLEHLETLGINVKDLMLEKV
jgi:hypothetical protein